MIKSDSIDWKKKLVSPEEVLERLKPGMNIFLGTGMAEPRTLVKHLVQARSKKIQDLEFLQVGSYGDAAKKLTETGRHRLKSFFLGWTAEEVLKEGRMDLIPCRPSKIPSLIESGQIPIDVAFFQVTPPNSAGYCSLGGAVDVALPVMEKASLRVAEINSEMPITYGDSFFHFSEFDMLVESTEPLIYYPRPAVDDVTDRIAANLASVIEDGSCIIFSIGVIFEALGKHLVNKKHLGIHSPFITDAVMDLVKSGAVTNRRKANWRGRSLTSYAFGTREFISWLDRNPLVEFQGLDRVFDPGNIGRNSKVVTVSWASKIDLTGRVVLSYRGEGVMEQALDIFNGAGLSASGRRLLALSSRDENGESNIRISVDKLPNRFGLRETVDIIVTEYGIATMYGRTIRERAQTLIDIAHPDDRASLVEEAKKAKIIYQDQIFLSESAQLYPHHVKAAQTMKNGLELHFRAIRPSDEEEMRRLFYRFSEEAVYYRYFTKVMAMPHNKTQEYVNIDYKRTMSIVAITTGAHGKEKIVAEARYVKDPLRHYAEVAFVVDEAYQNHGIASYLLQMLIRVAKENGVQGFYASVKDSNNAMVRVLETSGLTVETRVEKGVFTIFMPF